MSRQLRKLQAADILAQPDSEEDKQPHISSSRPQSNLFDLLDDAAGDATETLDDIEPIANELKPATKQGRKKKKKKAAVTEKSLQPADDDDWESVLGQMADLSTACDQGTEESISQTKKIMNIEKVMLQAANEMAKRFGTRAPPLSRRIVVKKAQWPPFELGLSMTCDRVGQEKHFNIVHSQHYRDIQRAFLESISTHDPDSIYNVLTMHPYHLDALLCVSQILKPSNIDSAREMVERALFCIEQSFHTMYSLDSPLDYNKIENRSVYFVLSRHISFLSSQGCWRTSLEYSKWLLNLDHLDPLAAKLTIDFYAIKAREYSWFLTFQSLFPSNLPNALYSVAVATFEKELLLKSNHVKSTQLLHTAISKYPRVANLLADRLSIKECVQVNA